MRFVTFTFVVFAAVTTGSCLSRHHRKVDEVSDRMYNTNTYKVIISGEETEPIDILGQVDNPTRYSECRPQIETLIKHASGLKVEYKSITSCDIGKELAMGRFRCHPMKMKVTVMTRHFLNLEMLGEKQTVTLPTLDVGVACVIVPPQIRKTEPSFDPVRGD